MQPSEMSKRRNRLTNQSIVVAIAFVLAGCGGSSDVARVGSTAVTKADYDQALQHFRNEYQRSGKTFPAEGTRDYGAAKKNIVSLLVYRAELTEGAKRFGISVSDADAAARVAASSQAEDDDASEVGFSLASARASILYERIYLRVTQGIPRAKRDAAMRRWLRANHERLARSTTVST
jgi:hypothetical protein